MGRIRIGISAWNEPALIKTGFYPPGVKTPEERLRYYSAVFPITEVDSSFYAFPGRDQVALWLNNTPAGFIFNVKAFRMFTQHPTRLGDIPRIIRAKITSTGDNMYINKLPQEITDELWSGFAGVIQPIQAAGKLGVVFLQFPPWFHPRPENLDYLAMCREKLSQYQLAIEFRTSDWLGEKDRERTLSFLREHGLALVCVDEPQGCKSCVPPIAAVTAPLAVVRFHGRNGENWEKKDITSVNKFDYLYQEAELKEWVPKVKQMAAQADEVHLIFKNKAHDYPVRNARQMKELLGL